MDYRTVKEEISEEAFAIQGIIESSSGLVISY
jgi:hypothetical protein